MTATDPVAVARELAPQLAARADAHDRTGTFPAEDVADLRDAGLMGLLVPEQLGGWGAGFATYTRVAQEIAQGSGSTALVLNMHSAVTGSLAGVPEELARSMGAGDAFFDHRDGVLAAAAQGAVYGVAITEMGVGSRLSATTTTYAPTDGGWHLRGAKSVCSGAGHLDAYLVPARRPGDPPDGEDPVVSHFLVPAAAVGEVTGSWDVHGMRATASLGFTLDAEVGPETLLGGVEGLAVLLAYVLPQWLVSSYAAVYVGVARAAVTAALDHISRRGPAGPAASLGDIPWVRARLGRADAQVEAARLVLEDAGRRVDSAPGEPETNAAIYRAKLLAGDTAAEVAATVSEACGLGALRRGEPLERILRDARSGPVMPPSSDLAADVLGTMILGRDPVRGTGTRPW